jgi:hypothetical protein
MGQAKRRGTFEERKAEGEVKAKIKAKEDYLAYIARQDARPLKGSVALAIIAEAFTYYPLSRR